MKSVRRPTIKSPMGMALGILGMLNLWACGGTTVDPGPSSGGSSGGSTADGGASSGGSSGGSAAGGGTSSGGSSGGTGNGTLSTPCTSPEPEIAGQDTGFFRCSEGYIHRPAAHECPSVLPRERVLPPTIGGASGLGGAASEGDLCNRDSDCPGDHAKCELVSHHDLTTHVTDYRNECSNGCRVDADCGAGSICQCGEEIGTCVAATCQTDADCSGDALCVGKWQGNDGCLDSQMLFACHEATDECLVDEDCFSSGSGNSCWLNLGSGRACTFTHIC